MSKIAIVDLEVHFHIGVTNEERARPQRLLLTVDMSYDFSTAAATDRVTKTIDYFKVTQKILRLGEGRSWKLIEKLVTDVANLVLNEFYPTSVTVMVKKFPIPQASYVAVSLTKHRATTGMIKRSSWGIP
jgi:7,8-dihydroneopterin aldolase/epimerase/oxygenase